jgi:hypothetical protein
MGAAVALHSAACYAHGKFTSGIPYPISLSAVISLSGWLPCSRSDFYILFRVQTLATIIQLFLSPCPFLMFLLGP